MSGYDPPMENSGTPDEPDDFRAMMIGAALIVVLSFVPYVRMACCLNHLIGIWLAVHLFTRHYSLTLSYGQGIKLGILTCLLGNVSAWLIGMGIWLATGGQPGAEEGRALALFLVERMGDPEAVEEMRKQLEAQAAQEPGLLQLGLGLISVGITSAVSGLIGGATGALFFRRGKPVQPAGETS